MSREHWTEQLEQLKNSINEYHKMEVTTDGDGLNRVMQKIGTRLFYLTTIRAEVHAIYQEKMKEYIDAGTSVNKAIIECDNQFPEMYQLRRILEEAGRVHTACSVHISYLKNEKRQTRSV